MNIQTWVREALHHSRPCPGEQVEIYALSREEENWEWHEGRLENREHVHTFGAGVRILAGGRAGFAYRADTRMTSLSEAVEEARGQLAYSQPDPARRLPSKPGPMAPSEAPVDSPASSEGAMTEISRRMERAAAAADPRVTKITQTGVRRRREWIGLASSEGLEAAWPKVSYALSAAALAEDGRETQLGEEYRAWSRWQALNPEAIGRAAGERAASLLGSRPIASGKRTLLLPPHVVAGFLDAAWEAWSGDAVQRGRSFLAGRQGETLAAAGITLVDDGLLADGLATAPWDDEGTPSQRTVLLEGGRLAGFLYNAESANRGQARSTGNGKRYGFKQQPGVGPTNFMLLPGNTAADQLRAGHPEILEIAEVLGLHTLDPVNGEFSLGASGRLLDHGHGGQPVRGITIAGTVEGLLANVVAVGSELVFYGNFGAPALLVDGIMVSGS